MLVQRRPAANMGVVSGDAYTKCNINLHYKPYIAAHCTTSYLLIVHTGMHGTRIRHQLRVHIGQARGKLDGLGARVHGHDVGVGAAVFAGKPHLLAPFLVEIGVGKRWRHHVGHDLLAA
jgi:hypothetical protein